MKKLTLLAVCAIAFTACKKETTTVQTIDGQDTITTTTSSTEVGTAVIPDSADRAKVRSEAEIRWQKAKADVNAAIAKGDKKAEEAARKAEAEAKEAWEKIKADTKEAREDLKEGYNNTLEKAKIE